ncbi:MAG: hypothetical protein JJT89_06655 [Nitriliruptoraceae bacterium]|nr:hypothetical protein [Nitriliruptoraceae bacterium]
MSADLDPLLAQASRGPERDADPDAIWAAGRRRRRGRLTGGAAGAVIVLAVASVGLLGGFSELPSPTIDPVGPAIPQATTDVDPDLVPAPGDELEPGVARDHALDQLPSVSPSGLVAVLHAVGPTECAQLVREVPDGSLLSTYGPSGELRASPVDPICRGRGLPDGRLLIDPIFEERDGDGEPDLQLLDPRSSALERARSGLERGHVDRLVVGVTEDDTDVLQTAGSGRALRAVDPDTGDSRTLIDLDVHLPEGHLVLAAAHRAGTTVLLAGERPGGTIVRGVGQRGGVTQLWVASDDTEPQAVRDLGQIDDPEAGATIRNALGPRLVDGPDGLLIVTVEQKQAVATEDGPAALELVLTDLDGNSRIAGRLFGTFGLPNPGSAVEPGPSLDVVGDQVLVGLLSVAGDEIGPGVVTLFDLRDPFSWYRTPIEDAALAWFGARD